MAVKVFTIDMNGGDETSADTAIYFKIYGSADSYTAPIVTTGVHGTTGVSVSAGTATVTWEVGTETAFKVTQVDEAGNESVASAVYDTVTDVTAPTLSAFQIPDANPDRIYATVSEDFTVSTYGGITLGSGKTITGVTRVSASSVYFNVSSAYVNGDGNDTFAYSGTGCNLTDLNSNVLASFTAVTVTNNVSASGTAPTMTLVGYDAPVSNNYNTNGTGYTNQYAVSTTAEFIGAMTYEIEIDTEALHKGTIIGLSDSGTNRAYNSDSWEFALRVHFSTYLIRVINAGVFGAPDAGDVLCTFTAGDKMKLVRDGSNVVRAYYNTTLIHTFPTPLSGNLWVHFSHEVPSVQASNPLIS